MTPIEAGKARDLFVRGMFPMHSGGLGTWKIECDALTDADVDCLAFMLTELLPPFGRVVGIPRGGTRIAFALEQFAVDDDDIPRLIVDDVLTTGRSMEDARQWFTDLGQPDLFGAVLFARGPCPEWITPLFTMGRP